MNLERFCISESEDFSISLYTREGRVVCVEFKGSGTVYMMKEKTYSCALRELSREDNEFLSMCGILFDPPKGMKFYTLKNENKS